MNYFLSFFFLVFIFILIFLSFFLRLLERVVPQIALCENSLVFFQYLHVSRSCCYFRLHQYVYWVAETNLKYHITIWSLFFFISILTIRKVLDRAVNWCCGVKVRHKRGNVLCRCQISMNVGAQVHKTCIDRSEMKILLVNVNIYVYRWFSTMAVKNYKYGRNIVDLELVSLNRSICGC